MEMNPLHASASEKLDNGMQNLGPTILVENFSHELVDILVRLLQGAQLSPRVMQTSRDPLIVAASEH